VAKVEMTFLLYQRAGDRRSGEGALCEKQTT
jgi:hypothetical protein